MLEEWYKKNPGSQLNGRRFDCRGKDYDTLNELQRAHIRGEIDLYEPTESYKIKWVHKMDNKGQFKEAYPLEETSKRMDLPSVSVQWKQAFKRRHVK